MIDTKEKLVAAGIKLMLEGGFSATGIRDIVEMAGVPKGSFYYYYESKDIYTAEVVDRYAETSFIERAKIFDDVSTPPLCRLRKSFELYLQNFTDNGFSEGCLLGNLSAEMSERNDIVRARLRAAFRSWEADIARMLRDAKDAGNLPDGLDPIATASFLLNAWEGALVRMKTDKDGAALHTFLDFFDRLLPTTATTTKGASA